MTSCASSRSPNKAGRGSNRTRKKSSRARRWAAANAEAGTDEEGWTLALEGGEDTRAEQTVSKKEARKLHKYKAKRDGSMACGERLRRMQQRNQPSSYKQE